MLLMIDNYDSFTYNVVQYLGELGADVHVHRNDEITIEQIRDLNPEKIVISPGPCTPNEAGVSLQVLEQFKGKWPILVFAWAIKVSARHSGETLFALHALCMVKPHLSIITTQVYLKACQIP